ncbi:30S ribosomal protein S4 [uncultured bacterium]|uniref:Putative 30S ribosomal protein S4 n=1 Tax=uncultured microorganism TaxID=358574 RepID=A0A077JJG5_9ZZZZ|nr:putative 30S ribosomal protein S4 [uncultured microorganism]BCL65654.1 30S ribosomal protein S4 [uncultured bacterium]
MNRRKYKYKVDRSLLTNIFNSPKSSFNKRPTRPGMHGKKMISNTMHGEMLNEKRKLATYYQIKDYQLKSIVKKSIMNTNFHKNIIRTLESRILTILYRSGCFKTIREARQQINHKKISFEPSDKSNIKLLNSPSVQIKKHGYITFDKSIIELVKNNLSNNTKQIPKHIIFMSEELKLEIIPEYIPEDIKNIELSNIKLENIVSYYKF